MMYAYPRSITLNENDQSMSEYNGTAWGSILEQFEALGLKCAKKRFQLKRDSFISKPISEALCQR